MKCKFLLLFIILILRLFSEIIWEVDYDALGGDYANIRPSIALFEDGSFAVVGRITYDDGMENLDTWGLMAKFDENGSLLWTSEELGDDVGGIIESDEDHIITAGQDFLNGYVIKRDSNGEVIWQIEMSDFRVQNIVRLDSSSFALIGSLNDQQNASSIRKIDDQGSIVWTRNFNMGANWSWFLNSILASDGCIVLIGARYYDWATADAFTMKISADGDSLWSQFHPENFNKWIFESSENNLIVLGRSENFKLDLLGNILVTHEGDYDYGIDLPNENKFLARNDEYGSPNHFDIFQFDYDLNSIWSTDEYFRYYFIQLPDNGFLFFRDCEFHFIRTNEDFVNITDDLMSEFNIPQIQNFPNPFNPTTTISFSIPKKSKVDISIYNMKGQKIKTLIQNEYTKGNHSITWNGDNDFCNVVSSGVYLYKLNVNGKTEAIKKCLLLK